MDYVERVSENMQLFAPVDVLTGRDFLYEYDPEVSVNQVLFLQISPLMWILIFVVEKPAKQTELDCLELSEVRLVLFSYFSFHFYTIRIVC